MLSKWITVGRSVAVGVALLNVACSGGGSGDKAKQAAPSPSTSASASAPAGDRVEFRDDKGGWAISYPKSWSRLESNDRDVSLVVSEKAPGQNATGGSILARTVALGAAVGPEQLAEAKKVTDQIVTSGAGVQLLAQPTTIRQGGLAGYFYFYSFKDSATGQEGAHSHYFLFKGATMISFVFQAVPKGDFPRLAPTFDEVIGSFRLL
jgi:hypothetical protein